MSLVLGYANRKNAIIMSDGRAGGTVSPSEYYDKTRKINRNIILGFVGYKETAEHFLNCTYQELGEGIKNCFIEDVLEVFQYGMGLDSIRNNLKSTFAVIGRTREGKMITAVAGNSTGYKIEKNTVDRARALFIGGSCVEREWIEHIFFEHMSRKFMSIEECMKRTILDASKADSSINANTFAKLI